MDNLTGKQKSVFNQVKMLYEKSKMPLAYWLWENHVKVVGEKSLELAKRYKANAETTFAGALLHDFGDIWLERADPGFEATTRNRALEVLEKAGYKLKEALFIIDEIIGPHSCHGIERPKTLEGKILATADALAHLETNFYYDFKKMGYPKGLDSEEFKDWMREKLERDFKVKIFFDEIRKDVRFTYEKLKKDFGLNL